MTTQFDVVSWNVNGFVDREQPELLAQLDWDVCAIQEATTPERLERFAARAGATSWCSAREHLDGAHADRSPAYVAAVLARGRARVTGSSVVEGAPSPERALVATVELDGSALLVGSMALPPASSPAWGPALKVEQCRRIVAFLRSAEAPVIVGLDANTPRRDAIDLADTEFWNDGEEELLGPEADHGLRDVYRELVERDSARLAELRRERPEGPLAVS